MDEESKLETVSDIDEIEKEKAIESIVLHTSTEDNCKDDFDESFIPNGSNYGNFSHSLYDADESMKSTDIENGNQTVELKETLLDSASVDEKQSESIENVSQSPLKLDSEPLPHEKTNQVIIEKPAETNPIQMSPQSNLNKILYVKLMPRTNVQPVIVSTATESQSPPKSIPISTVKSKQSPIKMTVQEPTTSNLSSNAGGMTPKTLGHTVNLLNNNRILIKSVKNNNHTNTCAQQPTSTSSSSSSCASVIKTSAESTTMTVDDKIENSPSFIKNNEIVDVKQQTKNVTNESTLHVMNVEKIEEIDQQEQVKSKLSFEMNRGPIDDCELEIKKELLSNKNSIEQQQQQQHMVDDIKISSHTIEDDDDGRILVSAKKIKREFEQLQKTVNESKVLSEFIIEHSKRERRPTKSGKSKHKYNNSLTEISNSSADEKFSTPVNRSSSPSSSSVRSMSKESDRSVTSSFNSSTGKRNTRSMNTDFSAKQKQFLKGIQQVTRGTDDETDNNSGVDDDDDDLDYFTKQQPNIIERRKSTAVNKQSFNVDSKANELKTGWDKYCWRCHQLDTNLFCSTCVRSYHANCLKMKQLSPAEMAKWPCPECVEIKIADKENKKKKFDVKHFNKLLKYAMNRILQDPNLQQFQFPVNKTQNPGYADVIVNQMNLSKIENNIDNLMYTNSEAFLSDIKWILHNCSIYFSDNYKVTRAAKSLQKVSKQEVGDIETCPECYLNANTMTDNWFTETCVKPHLILWAKLKGFPYWPAKAMSINSTLVDVRFFGEHDRANIPAKDCFLYSREDPNPPTNKYKRNTIADCVKEVDVYIENIIAKYGQFNYAELKTPFNPQMAEQHLIDMIPGLRSVRGRRRSSTARPDLTLKIVKTADNNLSVVKKDQIAKELPQIKRTVDITGEIAVSRTPTPPSAVLSRRKTSDTRIKRSKSTNRHSDGKLSTLDHKSYQVMRRKSMAVEKLDQKRRSAIHSKLDLNSANESPEVSFVRYNSQSTNERVETDLIVNAAATAAASTAAVAKKTNKTTAKKRKLSIDSSNSSTKANDAAEMPDKLQKNARVDDPTTSSNLKEKIEENSFIETNILSSVGLVKKLSAPDRAQQQLVGKKISTTSKSVQNKNSTCDTEDKRTLDGAARTRRDTKIQRIGSKDDSSPILLVPFIDIKREPEINENNAVNSLGNQTPSASQTPISLISSNENTPAKNYACFDENLTSIKTETSSDDDSLMIIEDDLSTSTNSPAKLTSTVSDSRVRGSISVKDINKMTLQNQQQNARKTFPKGPSSSNATTSILKPRANTLVKPPMNQTNMVCIPLDGLPRLDLTYNSTKPPPLSVVGSANSVSLLTQNQPLSSVTSTSNLNGPPPLSITSISAIPTVVSVSQSLLNPNSINTISNGMITESLASAVTDQIIRRNPPQLTHRPVAPLRSECDSAFPSEAGSLCKTLMENAHKMTDFFRSVIEDTLGDLANMSNPEAKIRLLELEMEKQKNAHAKEIADIRANTDRLLSEMKKNMEKERTRVVNETRKQCEMERIRSMDETKKKQWCANCLKEAQFYCCWNTSYCSYICQRKHWEQHMTTCVQMEASQNVQNVRR
ncbi:protein kinase C-binding protein 1-like isoform X2 [Contarinia nasturtii]|uniref:protein kinase C-binding protein 1-like isoform X2 n=1 Tax=Contarinia nasturtii TaxID=265458 RepID=UPI0012D41665|nr:protein kinase C-binding protein 1-like isoform X2 [Contarinia nasturtii]